MGFNFLPYLPIVYKPFGFMKSVNLKSEGRNLEVIPYVFGWVLVEWQPITEKPREAIDLVSELCFGDLGTGFSAVSGLGEFETGAKPVSEYVSYFAYELRILWRMCLMRCLLNLKPLLNQPRSNQFKYPQLEKPGKSALKPLRDALISRMFANC